MSVQKNGCGKASTVWCDIPNCGGHETTFDTKTAAARRTLRRLGWRYVSGHPTTGPGRDLCPEHAAGAS